MIGTQSPGRTLAMGLLVADCIARHGWSERLKVECAGFGDGAGVPSPAELGLMAEAGLDTSLPECPDVEARLDMLEQANYLVVGCADDAVMFLEWPEAEGKQVLALSDFLGDEGWALGDPDADFGVFFTEAEAAAPLLLRALIAHRP
ncbi:MAG: hypothetical protein D6815_07125 [Candidatus Dadabacteria bacterium]|nr:MAG: hypothetical protein D6815_07125 [Candidatus Dadabacteria bacterium]